MKSFLVQRWLKSLAALSIGGLMIAAPALGQGSKDDAPKSPAAEAAKDKEKDRPNTPSPSATPSDSKAPSADKAPSKDKAPSSDKAKDAPAPPSGTTPASPAAAVTRRGTRAATRKRRVVPMPRQPHQRRPAIRMRKTTNPLVTINQAATNNLALARTKRTPIVAPTRRIAIQRLRTALIATPTSIATVLAPTKPQRPQRISAATQIVVTPIVAILTAATTRQ